LPHRFLDPFRPVPPQWPNFKTVETASFFLRSGQLGAQFWGVFRSLGKPILTPKKPRVKDDVFFSDAFPLKSLKKYHFLK
jgi:hypothetical protein